MKKKKMIVAVVMMLLWVSVVRTPEPVHAVSEGSLRVYNVLGQGALTVLRGVIQGEVKSFKDAGRMFLYGSAAGYGFFEAKRMVGKGHITGGYLLANLAASVSENVSWGESPLSHISYVLGPARLRVATPLARKGGPILDVTVSPADVYALFYSLKYADRLTFKNGILSFTAAESRSEGVRGWMYGVFPTVVDGKPDHVFNHEIVHVVQYLQAMSISPQPLVSQSLYDKDDSHWFRFSGLGFNTMKLMHDLAVKSFQSYDQEWLEIEAYALAPETAGE